MKVIDRSDFRVRVVLRPTELRHLGLQGLEGQVVSGNVEVLLAPRRLGDFGMFSVSDSMVSRDPQSEYERRAKELAADLRRESHVASAEVECTETVTCSHCGLTWEEFSAEDAERYPDWGDPVGLPQCCEEAQAEWRDAQKAGAA